MAAMMVASCWWNQRRAGGSVAILPGMSLPRSSSSSYSSPLRYCWICDFYYYYCSCYYYGYYLLLFNKLLLWLSTKVSLLGSS